jgi:hypothetical protein
VAPDFVTLETVKVTLGAVFLMLLLLTEHTPLVSVVQELEPVAPLLQVPATTAPATAWWPVSWTAIVTLAVHAFFCSVREPSRSPMCIEGSGVGMEVPVEVLVAVAVLVLVAVLVGVGVSVGVSVLVGVEV